MTEDDRHDRDDHIRVHQHIRTHGRRPPVGAGSGPAGRSEGSLAISIWGGLLRETARAVTWLAAVRLPRR